MLADLDLELRLGRDFGEQRVVELEVGFALGVAPLPPIRSFRILVLRSCVGQVFRTLQATASPSPLCERAISQIDFLHASRARPSL